MTSLPQETAPAAWQEATFGSGCFWCTEAVFQELQGVLSVVSGYTGGQTKSPTYRDICTGATGHAEVIRVRFDPTVTNFAELLEVFWMTHDPTTLNRQGPDVGTQYRSVVFYHSEDQRSLAEGYRQQLNAAGAFPTPIVTEIVPLAEFYPAENYHQNYYRDHPDQAYCAAVIGRKLEKFRQVFSERLKT